LKVIFAQTKFYVIPAKADVESLRNYVWFLCHTHHFLIYTN